MRRREAKAVVGVISMSVRRSALSAGAMHFGIKISRRCNEYRACRRGKASGKACSTDDAP